MAKVTWAVLGFCVSWLLACSGENDAREQEPQQTAEAKAALSSGEWPSQTLLATNSIQLEDRAKVTGNVAVKAASSTPLSSNAELVLGADSIVTGNVQADTLLLRERSRVTGTAQYNTVQNAGTIQGGGSSPLSLPLAVTIPALPSIAPGSQNVTLANSQQQTLAAGAYQDVTVNSGNGGVFTKLSLSGLYQLKSLTVLNDAVVECTASCEIRVQGRLSIGDRSFIGPKSGVAGLGVGNVQVIVAGSNASSGPLGMPSAALFGNDAKLSAYLFAPNGTVRLGQRSILRGKVLARDVLVGADTDGQGSQLPIVVTNPQSLTVREHAQAVFTVTATGTGLSYQWQRDGANVSGATGATYTIASANLSDSGKQFRVVVRNAAGSVTSGTATLTVTPCGTTDTTCDNVDDNCNGTRDEGFGIQCAAGGSDAAVLTCVNGAVVTSPCTDDDACNGAEVCASGVCSAGAPPVLDDGNSCTVDACSSGSGISHTPVAQGTACGGSNVCNATGQCGAPGGGQPTTGIEFFIKLPVGISREDVALGTYGADLRLEEKVLVLASPSGFSSVSGVDGGKVAKLEKESQVQNVWSDGPVIVQDLVHVHGFLKASGTVPTPAASSIVGGGIFQNVNLEPLQDLRWTVQFPNASGNPLQVNSGETVHLAPGNYSYVTVKPNGRLELSAGTYFFRSLKAELGSITAVLNSSAAVFAYIRDEVSLEGSVQRSSTTNNVLFGFASTQDVALDGPFSGVFVAPHAHVWLGRSSSQQPPVEHHGSFFAKSMTVKKKTKVHHEPLSPEELCDETSTTCNGLCPCEPGQGECQTVEDCRAGLTCEPGVGARYGKRRAASVCTSTSCDLEPGYACGYADAPCGNCYNAAPCEQNSDCEGGEVCGFGLAPNFGIPASGNVCVVPGCITNPVATGCGEVNSPCGDCACTPQCEEKACGDDLDDGCGGRCEEVCAPREPGCENDADCTPGNLCFFGAGPRVGLAAGTNVCLPLACDTVDPSLQPCGSTGDVCGTCLQPEQDVCANRVCGEDPAYGIQCGADCSEGLTCEAGQCIPQFQVATLTLTPSTGGEVAPLEPSSTPQSQTVGALPGAFDVDERGAPRYRVPIFAPPGKLGMTPELALVYNGRTKNGIASTGWSIDGLSSIGRCAKTHAVDGIIQEAQYDEDDALCLDGHRLVQTSGYVLQAGAEYRTEIETFSKIVAIDVDGELAFKVFKKDGRIFVYGGSPNSRLYRDLAGRVVRAWALSQVGDRFDNLINYFYGQFEGRPDKDGVRETMEFFPEVVTYAGGAIHFEYNSERVDSMLGYTRGGAEIRRSRLLKSIGTWVGSTNVREYKLDYEDAPQDLLITEPLRGIPWLKTITECSSKHGSEVCKSPTTFDYLPPAGFAFNTQPIRPIQNVAELRPQAMYKFGEGPVVDQPGTGLDGSGAPLIVLDANGDGLDDLLTYAMVESFGVWKLLLATGSRTGEPYVERWLRIPGAATTDTPADDPIDSALVGQASRMGTLCFTQNSVFDYNGDGRDDLLNACNHSILGADALFKVLLSERSSPADPLSYKWSLVENHLNSTAFSGTVAYLADVDGNGAEDLAFCASDEETETGGVVKDSLHVHRRVPGGAFSAEPSGLGIDTDCSHLLVEDIDGDGTKDILSYGDSWDEGRGWARFQLLNGDFGSWRWLGDGINGLTPANWQGDLGRGRTFGPGAKFIDYNGDGLKDLIQSRGGSKNPRVYLNKGSMFSHGRGVYRDSDEPRLWEQSRSTYYSLYHALVFDFDGNGREDLLRPLHAVSGEDPGALRLWQLDLANSNLFGGVFTPDTTPTHLSAPHLLIQPQVNPNRIVNNPDVHRASALHDENYGDDFAGFAFWVPKPVNTMADVDGDGSLDLVSIGGRGETDLPDDRLIITYGAFEHAHLLHTVTDGLGKKTTVEYLEKQAFSDGETRPTYQPAVVCNNGAHGSNGVNVHCLRRMSNLVSGYRTERLRADSTAVTERLVRLRYEGATEGLYGRGWLGFAKRFAEEATGQSQLISTTETTFENEHFDAQFKFFPFAGLVKEHITRSAAAKSKAEFVRSASEERRTNTWAVQLSHDGRPFPALVGVVEGQSDVTATNSLRLIGSNTELVVDEFGNTTDSGTIIARGDEWLATRIAHTTFAVDEANWLIGFPDRVSVTEELPEAANGELSRTRTVDYDFTNGVLERVVREPDAPLLDSRHQTTLYVRDIDGNVEAVRRVAAWSDPHSEETPAHVIQERRTSFVFDSNRLYPERIEQHIGGDTLSSDVRYDPRDGTLVSSVDPNGLVQRRLYDEFGRLVQSDSPGEDVTISYSVPSTYPVNDARMEVALTSSTDGRRATQLDALGRPVRTVSDGLLGAEVLQETSYLFGALPALITRPHLPEETSQGSTVFHYDERFRLESKALADGSEEEYLYASWRNIAEDPLDPAVAGEIFVHAYRPPQQAEEQQRQLSWYSNFRGDIVRHKDRLDAPTTYVYEPFGALGTMIDSDGNVTTRLYDQIGRMRAHIDGDSGTTSYEYTGFDQISVLTDALPRRSIYEYDELGRLVTLDNNTVTTFAYDGPASENARGRLVETASPDGHVERYNYELPPLGGDPLQNRGFLRSVDRFIAGETFSTDFEYASNGQLEVVNYPSSGEGVRPSVRYCRDAAGNVTGVKDAHQGDCSSTGGPGDTLWMLDTADQGYRIAQETFGNGVTTEYGYAEHTGLPTLIRTRLGTEVLNQLEYLEYDLNRNLKERRHIYQGDGAETTTVTESFNYDPRDRLVSTTRTQGLSSATVGLTYDDVGNILTKGDVGGYDYTARPDQPFRPHGVQRIHRDGEQVASVRYDAVGNVVERRGEGVKGGVQTISYNAAFNLPQRITLGEGEGATELNYEYDARQNRVLLTIGEDDQRVYVGDEYERHTSQDDGDPVIKHLYKVYAAGRQVAQIERKVQDGFTEETRRYIHGDHQGSSQAFTNEAGELVHIQRFDPWGAPETPLETVSDDPAKSIRAGYTGHEMDVETGLINMKGRLYDPRIARFMQADPIMQAPFWSQGLNRYSYVFNNPLQWVDPSGFSAEDADDGDGVPEGGTLVGTTGEGDCGSGDCFAGGLEYVGPSDAQTQDETPAGSGDATGESAQAGDDPEVEYAQEDNEFESEALNYDADDYGPPTLDDYLSGMEVGGDAVDTGCCGPPQTLPSGGPWVDPNDVPEPILAALGLGLLAASPIPNSSRDSDEYLGPLVRAAHLAAEAELEGIPPGAIGFGMTRSGPRASTSVGRRGTPLTVTPGTNAPATIGGRNFTGHALDQMQSRGFTPTIVENAIQYGARSAGNQPGTFQHMFEGVRVITNEAGGVVTVIPR